MAQCIYSDWHGNCSMFTPEVDNCELGCDENGECWAEDDPDPTYSCSYFEDACHDEEEGDW